MALPENGGASAVRSLMGVTGVSDQVTLSPRVSAGNISSDIMHALHSSWFDPDTIKVIATGGNIALTGYVTSWHDRQVAAEAAWAAPGATSVVNDLTVE